MIGWSCHPLQYVVHAGLVQHIIPWILKFLPEVFFAGMGCSLMRWYTQRITWHEITLIGKWLFLDQFLDQLEHLCHWLSSQMSPRWFLVQAEWSHSFSNRTLSYGSDNSFSTRRSYTSCHRIIVSRIARLQVVPRDLPWLQLISWQDKMTAFEGRPYRIIPLTCNVSTPMLSVTPISIGWHLYPKGGLYGVMPHWDLCPSHTSQLNIQ